MINGAITSSGIPREFPVRIETIEDSAYNDQAWVIGVREIVRECTDPYKSDKIGIIGHKKDSSSFYLEMFPNWEFVEVGPIEPLGATDIRELYFKKDVNMKFIKNVVPDSVFEYLEEFRETEEYAQIIREREFTENYKKQFAGLPYPPVFVTSDAVVICSGHVLMIKRRSEPGKGLWHCRVDSSMQTPIRVWKSVCSESLKRKPE